MYEKFKEGSISVVQLGFEISFEDIYGITDIEWMGVHVQEHKTNMADIQFTEPKLTMVDSKFWIHFITAKFNQQIRQNCMICLN